MRRTARPKGKHYFPITITLTRQQIDYLEQKPNVSELVRKILDDLIKSEQAVQDKSGVISLNLQREQLEERLEKLRYERWGFIQKNDAYWKHTSPQFEGGGTSIEYANPEVAANEMLLPKPLDSEGAKIAFRVLQGYDKAINHLKSQIAKIEQQILGSE